MMRTAAAITVAILLSLGHAQATEIPKETKAAAGTMALMPGAEWAHKISDAEMSDMRGGFFGFSLSFLATGYFDNINNAVAGNITQSSGLIAPPAVGNNTVSLGVGIGQNSLNGFSGFFSNLQVSGVGNIVETNFFMNIVIVEAGASTAANLQGLLNQLGPAIASP